MKQHQWQSKSLLLALALLVGATGAMAAEPDGSKMIEEKGIRMSWAIDGGLLQITVMAPTTGWIGVGFDPKSKMKGANFIIGYVKDGEAVVEDHYGTSKRRHKKDTDLGGSDDVQDTGSSEDDGSTKLSFKIPLDSGDEFDNKLEEGKTITVLLAYGKEDDTTSKHRVVIKVSITL